MIDVLVVVLCVALFVAVLENGRANYYRHLYRKWFELYWELIETNAIGETTHGNKAHRDSGRGDIYTGDSDINRSETTE